MGILKTITKAERVLESFIDTLGRYRFFKSKCISKWKCLHKVENPRDLLSLSKILSKDEGIRVLLTFTANKFYTLNVLPIGNKNRQSYCLNEIHFGSTGLCDGLYIYSALVATVHFFFN